MIIVHAINKQKKIVGYWCDKRWLYMFVKKVQEVHKREHNKIYLGTLADEFIY